MMFHGRLLAIVGIGAFTLALASCNHTSNAEWKLESTESLGTTDGVQHIKKTITSSNGKAILHLAVFDSTLHDIVVIDDPENHHTNLGAAMNAKNCIAGINGGYFHPDYRPLGLVVSDGVESHGQERAKLLSGLLASNLKSIYLLRPSEFKQGKNTRQVLQAGPFLVDDSHIVKGLGKSNNARRTAVATDGHKRWAFLSASSLSLHELGKILADPVIMHEFKVQRALNLDGGSSSAFWFKGEGRPYYARELTRVRNYLGVVER